jgi:Ser-tRNA(Ala) deacylase AlaX
MFNGDWVRGEKIAVRKFSGMVTDIREESRIAGRQRWQMALDRTEFVAGDVGVLEAVARSGARLVVPVLEVVMDGGEVWHVVEKPLAAGTNVTGRVGEFAEVIHAAWRV